MNSAKALADEILICLNNIIDAQKIIVHERRQIAVLKSTAQKAGILPDVQAQVDKCLAYKIRDGD